jgi:hypothetical protein
MFSHEADGSVLINTDSSMIFTVGPGTLQASDTTKSATATPDGMLLGMSLLHLRNGELAIELELESEAGAGWLVTGTFRGKRMYAAFQSENIVSALGLIQVAQEVLQGEGVGATRAFPLWMADADPTRTVEGRFRLLKKISETEFFVELNEGPITTRGVTDASGSIRSGEIMMGPAQIHFERIYQAGEI